MGKALPVSQRDVAEEGPKWREKDWRKLRAGERLGTGVRD
jgi:hypothetical protein